MADTLIPTSKISDNFIFAQKAQLQLTAIQEAASVLSTKWQYFFLKPRQLHRVEIHPKQPTISHSLPGKPNKYILFSI